MKQIGSTVVERNIIVEMSRDEVIAFDRLTRAIEGKPLWESDPFVDGDRLMRGTDLANALEWVLSYARMISTLNEVQAHIDGAMKALVSNKSEKE